MGKNEVKINKVIITNDNKRAIKLNKSGIPSLYLLTDGVPYFGYKGEKTLYILITDAIKWWEKTSETESNPKNKKTALNNIMFLKNLLTEKLVTK